jgi:hypothetical protein
MLNSSQEVDLKIDEIIDILLLHPETEVPENYRELGEHLARFKLQKSQNPLESMFSMINNFEYYELFDESDGEPDNGELWDGSPEETGGSYSNDESFFAEFGDKTHGGITMIDAEELRYRALETQGMLDEMEWLKEQGEYSILTPVEHRVVLGLIMQVIEEVGGYNIDFITKMQDLLVLAGFSTDKVMEIMTLSQNSDNSYEYN